MPLVSSCKPCQVTFTPEVGLEMYLMKLRGGKSTSKDIVEGEGCEKFGEKGVL